MQQPERTWSQWLSDSTPSFLKPAEQQQTMSGTISDSVQGGRKRKAKTRRGGKKSRKSKPRRK